MLDSAYSEHFKRLNQLPREVCSLLRSLRHLDRRTLQLKTEIDVERANVLRLAEQFDDDRSEATRALTRRHLKNVRRVHAEMMRLATQKLSLAEQLYNCIDEPTERLEK